MPSAPNLRRQMHIGSLYGLASAVLFGASTPLCKLLLPGVGPLMLAALLYLGAAILITSFRALPLVRRRRPSVEARIRGSDAPALCAIVRFGGVIGPVLMLFGLARISALTGSLLLNLEAVFTIVLAVIVFREHLNRSSAMASALVVSGALLLSYQPGPIRGGFLGVMAIVGACLSWAIDNNVSQRLSLRDPVAVVQVKTAGAGLTSLMLALATGHTIPSFSLLVGALGLGSLSCASLICVMLALRHLGAAREAAWFSTAPFIGATLSIPIFGVPPTTWEGLGMIAMVAGVYLLVREKHSHIHIHEQIEHDHLHVHDEHHRHRHAGLVAEPHSHLHRHDPLIHEHPHVSDVHHRHRHSGAAND